jgi:hypothetical protein
MNDTSEAERVFNEVSKDGRGARRARRRVTGAQYGAGADRSTRAPSEALNVLRVRDHGTESSAVVSVERRAGAMQSLKAVAGVQKSQRQKCTRASPKCAC